MSIIATALVALSAALAVDATGPTVKKPMAGLLAPKGHHPGIGQESGRLTPNGIAKFTSPHGSTRYLLYEAGVPIAGLQVVSRDKQRAQIANVFTAPSRRREGLALKLLQKAKRDFETVTHSDDLSIEGQPWAEAVETIYRPLGEPDHEFVYWASCPDLTGEIIHFITDEVRARKITYQTFAARVDLEQLRKQGHPAMYRISAPNNWAISFWASHLPSGRPIYYFLWSRIEHIFVDPSRGILDPEHESKLARGAGY